MMPNRNTTETALIIWREARLSGDWVQAYHRLSGVFIFLAGERSHQDANYRYIGDIMHEAVDMMEDA